MNSSFEKSLPDSPQNPLIVDPMGGVDILFLGLPNNPVSRDDVPDSAPNNPNSDWAIMRAVTRLGNEIDCIYQNGWFEEGAVYMVSFVNERSLEFQKKMGGGHASSIVTYRVNNENKLDANNDGDFKKGTTTSTPPIKYTKLATPVQSTSNKEAAKYYVFNETGNIMMATTDSQSDTIQQSVRDVFAEVSVFFAAMTKAMSTTKNPETSKPYSIYNYEAIEKIVNGSGVFVHVTEEDMEYSTTSIGADFSKEMVASVLGLALGAGSLSFAQALITSMGKTSVDLTNSGSKDKVANIVFVCEYLLGMPVISTIVVYIDTSTNKASIKVSPCFSASAVQSKWKMHKDTYMFVTPTFIKEYGADLKSSTSSGDFNEYVKYLKGLLLDN